MSDIKGNQNFIGIFLILLYCITSSASLVTVSSYEQAFNPLKLTFYNFLLANLFFIILSLPKAAKVIVKTRNNLKLFWGINIATATAWMTAFYALKFAEPSVIVGIVFGMVPIVSLLFTLKQSGLATINKQDLYFASGILTVIIAIIVYYMLMAHTSLNYSQRQVYFALLLAVIAGIGTGWSVIKMKALSMHGFAALEVMSIRFFLIILLTAIILFYLKTSFFLTGKQFLEIMLIASLTVIIPLFLFQKGVERTTPINVAFIMPLQPVFTYLIQMIQGRFKVSFTLLILLVLLSTLILISAFFKTKRVYQNRA